MGTSCCRTAALRKLVRRCCPLRWEGAWLSTPYPWTPKKHFCDKSPLEWALALGLKAQSTSSPFLWKEWQEGFRDSGSLSLCYSQNLLSFNPSLLPSIHVHSRLGKGRRKECNGCSSAATMTEPLRNQPLPHLPKSTQLLLKTDCCTDPATTGSRAEPGLPSCIRKKR